MPALATDIAVRISYRQRRCSRSFASDDAEPQSPMDVSLTVAFPSAVQCRNGRDHKLQFVSESIETCQLGSLTTPTRGVARVKYIQGRFEVKSPLVSF
jgi:hypothetical protein